jgi:predicted glycosyltransferase
MLREACVLGVPCVSVFDGRLGAVDASLARSGRLTLLRRTEDVPRLEIARRSTPVVPPTGNSVLSQIVEGICDAGGRP